MKHRINLLPIVLSVPDRGADLQPIPDEDEIPESLGVRAYDEPSLLVVSYHTGEVRPLVDSEECVLHCENEKDLTRGHLLKFVYLKILHETYKLS